MPWEPLLCIGLVLLWCGGGGRGRDGGGVTPAQSRDTAEGLVNEWGGGDCAAQENREYYGSALALSGVRSVRPRLTFTDSGVRAAKRRVLAVQGRIKEMLDRHGVH